MIRSTKNKYLKMTHISERKFREIVRGFAADLTAQDVADLIGISRNTITIVHPFVKTNLQES